MTRLQQHRQALQVENRHGPLLRVEDLDPEDIELVNSYFLTLCRSRKVNDLGESYRAYVDTLNYWGVICPHPQYQRRYEFFGPSNVPVDFATCRWFDCHLCGTRVINR